MNELRLVANRLETLANLSFILSHDAGDPERVRYYAAMVQLAVDDLIEHQHLIVRDLQA